MKHDDCTPPADRRPIDDDTWTCPVCGDLWHVEPLSAVDPAYVFDMERGEGIVNATWVRGPKESRR
jgi:hypothetical protein